MTVSELLDKLKDCAPNAEVWLINARVHGEKLDYIASDGEKVVIG